MKDEKKCPFWQNYFCRHKITQKRTRKQSEIKHACYTMMNSYFMLVLEIEWDIQLFFGKQICWGILENEQKCQLQACWSE